MKAAVVALIALTIIGEGRNQPADGQACLAHTILNRMVRSGWSVEEVLFQPYQYRVWDWGVVAPEYSLRLQWLKGAALGQFPDNPWCMEPVLTIGSEEYWERVYGIAEAVYNGADPPKGCEGVTHYDNRVFWGGDDPPWAVHMELGMCVADHCFWRYGDGR